MIAVIFEVLPRDGEMDQYLHLASELRPLLEQVDGFISIERFQSLTEPEKLLSLSFFRDEQAVLNWRNVEAHRSAQVEGRASVLAGYRLRVAHVIRDYGMTERDEAPLDSLQVHSSSS